MILRAFPKFRDLETLAADQAEQIESLESALKSEVSSRLALEEELESAQSTAQMEQVRRISAEAIASERQAEIARLLESVRDLRADLKQVMGERIRSVDNINLKLMEAKIPEQPVDFKQYQTDERLRALNLHTNLVSKIRSSHVAIDRAILQESIKGFPKRHMNEPVKSDIGIVPTLEDIAKVDITVPAEAAS